MLEPQTILNECYQLQRQLGQTAVGRQTWLAEDTRSREAVTVKLLAFNPQMQWEELKLFEREGQVLRSLAHPRIPQYRDFFSLDAETGGGLPWFGLVQNYISGASLQEVIARGDRFSEEQVKRVARDVLEILLYLHGLNPPVLHRDIKPSNLIWGDDDRIYLIDFGAVQAKAAVTGVTFTIVGTGGYSPLEQFWGRAVPASDLYALGATLVHLLTGIAPIDLPQKETRLEFRDRVSISDDFCIWLENLLEIPLEKRYPSAEIALSELEGDRALETGSNRARGFKVTRPEPSKIQLQATRHALKIHIPERRLLSKFLGIAGKLLRASWPATLLVALLVGLLVLPTILIILAIPPIRALVFFTFLIFGAISSIMAVLASENSYVTFTRNYLEIERKMFGRAYYKELVDLSDVAGISLKSSGLGIYEVQAIARSQKYGFGSALSEEEAVWLVQEIQDWLNSRSR